jgi:hypothetical protein
LDPFPNHNECDVPFLFAQRAPGLKRSVEPSRNSGDKGVQSPTDPDFYNGKRMLKQSIVEVFYENW